MYALLLLTSEQEVPYIFYDLFISSYLINLHHFITNKQKKKNNNNERKKERKPLSYTCRLHVVLPYLKNLNLLDFSCVCVCVLEKAKKCAGNKRKSVRHFELYFEGRDIFQQHQNKEKQIRFA